jgi:hypothetical protein
VNKISEEVLNECLSPVPRDFENLSITKLSEEYRDGKYYVGYEVYVLLESIQNMNANILHEKGICIIVPNDNVNEDGYYMEELVDTVETEMTVDDINLPADVLESWKWEVEKWVDEDTAQDYLDSHEGKRSNVLTELCQKKVCGS